MERAPYTTLSLFVGPLLGLLIFGLAFLVPMGPGAAFFIILTCLSLVALAPLFQLFLLKFQGMGPHPLWAAALSIGSVFLLAVISTFTGIFNFW